MIIFFSNSFSIKEIVEKKVLLVRGIDQVLYKLPMSLALFHDINPSTTSSLPVNIIEFHSKVVVNGTLWDKKLGHPHS